MQIAVFFKESPNPSLKIQMLEIVIFLLVLNFIKLCKNLLFLRVKDQLEKLENDNKIKKMDGKSIKR